MPTCRVPAPKTTEVERFFLVLSLNCIPWSFIGFPATSIPCGFTSDGLPVGAELVAGPMEDGRLLALASALESAMASTAL
jgi:aspartyl-tRNA(Asn)/glutamyl-tRNA(Gln) amidotransferase subunit A